MFTTPRNLNDLADLDELDARIGKLEGRVDDALTGAIDDCADYETRLAAANRIIAELNVAVDDALTGTINDRADYEARLRAANKIIAELNVAVARQHAALVVARQALLKAWPPTGALAIVTEAIDKIEGRKP